jgi:uncharacterized RDD family membrane protein YckC
MTPAASAGGEPATLRRRLAAMVYELLVIVAIAFLVGLGYVLAYATATGESGTLRIQGLGRTGLQAVVLAALGAYFVWSWRRGRTLPMKTWDLVLVSGRGEPVTPVAALVRCIAAAAVFLPALVGALELRQSLADWRGWLAIAPLLVALGWSLLDRERQTLWDRIAGTRLLRVPRSPKAAHR